MSITTSNTTAQTKTQRPYFALLHEAEAIGQELSVESRLYRTTLHLLSELRDFDELTAQESLQPLPLALAVADEYEYFYGVPVDKTHVWSAVLLHDIGKATVGRDLVIKSNLGQEWTAEDRQRMRGHAAAGFRTARAHQLPYDVCRAIAEHHHRQTGLAYGTKAGLNDVERIIRDCVAVADFADAALNRTNSRNAHLDTEQRLAEVLNDVRYVFQDYSRGGEFSRIVFTALTQ